MDFPTWVSGQPRGVLKRIEREANAGYSTLNRLMRGERLDSYGLASRISEATGGEVTIDELCKPAESDEVA